MEKEIRQYNNAQLIPYFVEMINQGHTVTFKLKGFSMRPFLEDGRDKAILGKHTTVRCGDAVLAEISPKTYVLHRIVNIDGDKVTLRGTAILVPRSVRWQTYAASLWRSTAKDAARPTIPQDANGASIRLSGPDCCPYAATCCTYIEK